MTIIPTEDELEAPSTVMASYLRKTVSVSYLLTLAWASRWIVAVGAVLGFLYGVDIVHDAGPSYMATMRISPAESDSSLGDMGGGGGLLASLTGGSASAQVPKFIQFTYALGSVEVARMLDQKYDLLCRIYRGDCDPATHQWKPRTGLPYLLPSWTARLSGLPDPTIGPRPVSDLALYITNNVSLNQLKKTDSVNTLIYVNRNPKFAAEFLVMVVKTANDYVRVQGRETQKRYVDYLAKSAANTTNVEQRQAIDNLLLQEERQLMMTEVDVPYAAKILDGPTIAPVNIALKTITYQIALGMLIALAIGMSRDLLPRKWRKW